MEQIIISCISNSNHKLSAEVLARVKRAMLTEDRQAIKVMPRREYSKAGQFL